MVFYQIVLDFVLQGGCDLRNPHPTKFETLSSAAVRDNIAKLIRSADDGPTPYAGREDRDCNTTLGFLRCPLVSILDCVVCCCKLGDIRYSGLYFI